ncbi:hypothetical protein MCUN1_003193 [Malassezia cuniculi]|uniref:Mitochondrial fission process protein 1 n=1 Tax=Malassezia cuniculi TaxID=948313 RepID=A0AAF0J818_9BASI|nr:hypothetical protein MCUN1_003193 [Malassezia cuniculi]
MHESPDAIKVHHELDHPEQESAGRYVAYFSRLKTLITSGSRYIAYSSDIGEAFRPLTRPAVVTAAYGISWAYVFGDVGSVCWHASKVLDKNHPSFNEDIAWIALRRTVFQTLASAVFDRIELAWQRVRGGDISSSATKRYEQMTSVKQGFEPREVDQIPRKDSNTNDDIPESMNLKNVGHAAILGVGIDLVFLPRIGQLIARHAKRVARTVTPALASAPHYVNQDSDARAQLLEMQAARRLASRILSPSEQAAFSCLPHDRVTDQHVRYLASR